MTYVGSKRQLVPWLTHFFSKVVADYHYAHGCDFSDPKLAIWDLTVGGYNTLPLWRNVIENNRGVIGKVYLNDKEAVLMWSMFHIFKRFENGNFITPEIPLCSREEWLSMKEAYRAGQTGSMLQEEETCFKLLSAMHIQTFNGKKWGSYVEYESFSDRIDSSWKSVWKGLEDFWLCCKDNNVEIVIMSEDISNIKLDEDCEPYIIYIDPPYNMSAHDNEEYYGKWNKDTIRNFVLRNAATAVYVSEANIDVNEFSNIYNMVKGPYDVELKAETFVTKSSFNKKREMYERLFRVDYDYAK